LIGGWYAAAEEFAAVIAPFLDTLPPPSAQSVTPGTYIQSVQALGGSKPLDTTTVPDTHDTFYAKSIMIPEASPMTNTALNAFMSYLGNDGYTADTVRWYKMTPDQHCLFISLSRVELVRTN
jgi:hypothetical protein